MIVDIDPGMHRTGVATPDGVVDLVRKVTGLKSLKYAGVQFYCGRHQHIKDFKERKASIEERTEYLKGALAKLEAAKLKPAIVTGSGTGTHFIDAKLGVFTELQVGSYVFMDHEYNICDLRGLDKPTFEQALQIDARVVSANTPGMVTVDAGLKASFGFSVSGKYLVVLGRESADAASSTVRLRLFKQSDRAVDRCAASC